MTAVIMRGRSTRRAASYAADHRLAPRSGPRRGARHAAGEHRSILPTASTRSSSPSRRKPVTPSSTSSGAAPQLVRDDRRAARHRLDHHEPERLGPADREHHRACPAEQVDLRVVRDVLVQLDVVVQRAARRSRARSTRARAARCASGSSASGRPARRAIVIASVGPLSGLARPMYTRKSSLSSRQRVRVEVDAVVHGARVADVGVVGALRVADRDEVHVPVEQRVERATRFGPRAVQRVHDRRRPPRSAPQSGPDDAGVVVHDVEVVRDLRGTRETAWYASYQGLPSQRGIGRLDERRHELLPSSAIRRSRRA